MAFQFSLMAFRFPRNPRKPIYGGKYTKDHYLSFVFLATCSPSFVIPATMSTSPQQEVALAVAVVRLVGMSVGWQGQWPWRGWWLCSLQLVAWLLHTVGIVQICLGINFFRYKFYLACPDMPNRIYSIRTYSRFILYLFVYKFRYKPFIAILVATRYFLYSDIIILSKL